MLLEDIDHPVKTKIKHIQLDKNLNVLSVEYSDNRQEPVPYNVEDKARNLVKIKASERIIERIRENPEDYDNPEDKIKKLLADINELS